MYIKELTIIAAALVVLAGCTQKKDPATEALEGALKTKIAESVGATPENVEIYDLAKVDSVTLGQELERRRKTMELRIKKNDELYQKYLGKNMQNNAAKKLADIKKDQDRLKKLAAISGRYKDQADSVIARLYLLNGHANTADGGKVSIEQMYAAVTPDLRVLAFEKSAKALLKSTGHAVPGYGELYSGDEE